MNLQKKIQTPIGPLFFLFHPEHILGIFWEAQKLPQVQVEEHLFSKIIEQTESQLKEYFHGKRKSFDLSLNLQGTEFQKKVWKAVASIPYGKTLSYKELAEKIQNPKAVRAVGTANAKNPFCILIPCHRVIAHNGDLGGYSGGLMIKQKLLEIEKSWIDLKPMK